MLIFRLLLIYSIEHESSNKILLILLGLINIKLIIIIGIL